MWCNKFEIFSICAPDLFNCCLSESKLKLRPNGIFTVSLFFLVNIFTFIHPFMINLSAFLSNKRKMRLHEMDNKSFVRKLIMCLDGRFDHSFWTSSFKLFIPPTIIDVNDFMEYLLPDESFGERI
ncbi:hypothetical protein DMJ13_17310 [halophilic archaeon]|nr:hypothetical protein DMJ13_17310 [halophilic archaeon]